MARSRCVRLAYVSALLLVPLLAATLACIPGGSTPTEAPTAAPSEGCPVPDVVGLNQAAASKALTELGLAPRRVEEPSDEPVGTVISLNPPAGTQMAGCSGTVTIVVSSGSGGAAPTPAAPTPAQPTATLQVPTRAPSSGSGGGEVPEQDDVNMFYASFYEETFDERFNGFRPEWAVDADEGSAEADANGQLVTNAYVAAFIGDESWYNYRITFGGGYYDEITSFQVWVRMQDNNNFIGMNCFPSEGFLACEGYKYLNGAEQPLPGFQQTTHFCAKGQQQCDITIEAIGSDYAVLVNGGKVAGFQDSSFAGGGVGFAVDGKYSLDYFHAYDTGGGASSAYTLFRDDFDTNAWQEEATEDDYAVLSKQVENNVYHWQVTAKQGVTANQMRELLVPFDPEGFPYHFDYSVRIRQVSAPAGTAHGLLFRAQDYDNLYYFQVYDSGQCNLYALDNDQWEQVAGPYPAESFEAGGENVLRVVADGSRFSFWVNGYFVFQATDDRFDTGSIGVAVELANAGDKGEFEFDDARIGTSTWGG